ncbi:hypothetical protein FUA48_03065 [Flavobacterium alkalisoli]|uniref:Uncharacterized protein n=1 Tax=Flavobacterium alkalisoli TaxID=2602769 RepID=A0A5B9G327_9FLAO|nr:hypothetical protein FUA48_03065 [Flavobacterium alkalisoli]
MNDAINTFYLKCENNTDKLIKKSKKNILLRFLQKKTNKHN